ncbi:XRE family transcriptional regulator [Paraburkholderia sp. BL6669N2]|uniref:helix-turn-helix domain-containing protein n=1 Tax=Paraburkholderia sp. BL6669N2 TaxID=1938807 RepID=UPI000E24E267|nr:cupin domain-containing protein [Paraburkholderia sp. BL6669N2]REG48897.1 XRE family transcriptional regulator [Paraburkholderia sp. BL6669N2]
MPSTSENSNADVEMGGKIRALRHRLGRTLEQTAKAAGISKPFLSQVERSRASPSLGSLARIAGALGVKVQYFVDTPSEERSVRRKKDLWFFSFGDSATLFARMTNLSAGRKLEAILVRMPVGHEESEVRTHAGEEFLYVMAGEVSLTLEDKIFVLQAGDSTHYASTVPHKWRNAGASEAVVVWVGTPSLL